jgi:hypothetical protein
MPIWLAVLIVVYMTGEFHLQMATLLPKYNDSFNFVFPPGHLIINVNASFLQQELAMGGSVPR